MLQDTGRYIIPTVYSNGLVDLLVVEESLRYVLAIVDKFIPILRELEAQYGVL